MKDDERIIKAISELKERAAPFASLDCERYLIATICRLSMPKNISNEDLKAGIQSIKFRYKASDATDPFENLPTWLAQSPFDKKWYIFETGEHCPKKPTEVASTYPEWFDK